MSECMKRKAQLLTHEWFKSTQQFKDDGVVGINNAEWEDLDDRIAQQFTALQARLAQCEGERDKWKASCDLVEAVMQRDKLKAERDAALERVKVLEEKIETYELGYRGFP